MPSSLHEALVELFRERLSLAPDLLRTTLAVELPPFDGITLARSELGDVVPAEYRADVVLVLTQNGAPALALAVEVQLATDPRKRFTWPVYEATLRARYECDAVVLVVALSEPVAAWCAAPIALNATGRTMRPLVLGPRLVPVVADETEAGRSPELSLLSALAHAKGDAVTARETALAALSAARALDDERLRVYVDLVLERLPEAVRIAMEELMESGKYEFKSEYMKKWVAREAAQLEKGLEKGREQGLEQGRAEGRAEGREEGQALGRKAVLTLLAARGVAVPDTVRDRIDACRDLRTLDRWLTRAATAASADEVVMDEG